MKITNPNMVGSGYIAFPPQRPFEKPVFVQPPTVSVRRSTAACVRWTSAGCLLAQARWTGPQL